MIRLPEGHEYHDHMLRCIELGQMAPMNMARPYIGALVIGGESSR